jgi:hypothetical protein
MTAPSTRPAASVRRGLRRNRTPAFILWLAFECAACSTSEDDVFQPPPIYETVTGVGGISLVSVNQTDTSSPDVGQEPPGDGPRAATDEPVELRAIVRAVSTKDYYDGCAELADASCTVTETSPGVYEVSAEFVVDVSPGRNYDSAGRFVSQGCTFLARPMLTDCGEISINGAPALLVTDQGDEFTVPVPVQLPWSPPATP